MEGVDPKNLSAQLAYRGVGNPPSSHPDTCISNAFPGLEMDFRNAWKRIFVGIEIHEASNYVVKVDDDVDDDVRVLANGYLLVSVDGEPVEVSVTGPQVPGGPIMPLPDTAFNDPKMPIERSNALANVIHQKAGKEVRCVFRLAPQPGGALPANEDDRIEVMLRVRPFFATGLDADGNPHKLAVINRDIAEPGQLSESLCSPWQNDYRECGCYYWAASRPDFVNVESRPDGTSTGHNWMQRDRTPTTPKVYIVDDRKDPRLVTYDELFEDWEGKLRFEISGRDAE
ncbi:MAG TPA: hypothetical protein VF952_20650 [Chloroflexia bacterium]|jgi:hypothetical protein